MGSVSPSLLHLLKRLRTAYSAFSLREKIIVSIAGVGVAVALIYLPLTAFMEYADELERRTAVRTRELEDINRVAEKFQMYNDRLATLKETFAKSQMTFEEVTSELDKAVKETIGSDDYNLSRSRTPTQLGFEFEKQDFTLKINSLKFDQLVNLLYRLEQGDSPLFLGKVDISKQQSNEQFTATLEIFSVRKTAQA